MVAPLEDLKSVVLMVPVQEKSYFPARAKRALTSYKLMNFFKIKQHIVFAPLILITTTVYSASNASIVPLFDGRFPKSEKPSCVM